MKAKRALALLLSVALAAAVPVGALADDNSDDSRAAATAEESADPCAEGHNYEETVVDPTCTEDGYITYTCRECGDTYTDPGEKATGHDYNNGEVTKEATEDEEGEMTFTCNNCGDSYTEPIPKLEKKENEKKEDPEDSDSDDSGKDSSGKKSSDKKTDDNEDSSSGNTKQSSSDNSKKQDDSSQTGKTDDEKSSSGNTKQPSSDNSKKQDDSSQTGKTGGKDSSTTSSADSTEETDSGIVINEQEEELESAAAAAAAENEDEAEEPLPLWFAGRQVTKADCGNIAGDKSISYNEDSRTLTLNKANYSFKAKDSDDTPAALIVYSCKDKGKTDLTVRIKGDCILSASAEEDLRSVIRVEYGSLYIEGSGSLYIKGTDEEAALYAKEDIVLFEDAEDNDDAVSLNVEAKTVGLMAGEKISVKAGTLSVSAADRNGIALLAENKLTISQDLEIAKPASGKTFTDKKRKLATIVEKDETTPAAKVLIQEPEEEIEETESENEDDSVGKNNAAEQAALESESENEDDSAGKNNAGEQEALESESENEDDSAGKNNAAEQAAPGSETANKDDSVGKNNAGESVSTNTDVEPSNPSISMYPLTINGIRVTDENKGNIDGSGNISYDETTNTLTLDGYKGEFDPDKADSFISYTGTKDLNIEIKGKCSIQAESTGSYKSIIRAENASLVLKGSGSLTIESKEKDAAIYSGKNIVLFKNDNKPGTLEVESKTAAIKAKGSITMSSKLKIAEQVNGTIKESSDGSTSIIEEGESDPAKYVLVLPTDAETYTVKFSSGGAKGSMASVKVSPGPSGKAKYKLPECGFDQPFCHKNSEGVLKHGWSFRHWKINDVYYVEGQTVTIEKNTTVGATWGSSKTCVKKQAKVAPTCTNTGVKEHYKCTVCKKLFSDAAGTKEVTEASLVLPATGHIYGEPTYDWATDYSKVTAKHVCTKDQYEEEETVTTTKTGKDATCEEDGKWTYTAAFTKAGFTTQTKDITKKAIGHKWSPTWTWNEDCTKASLTLVCKNDASHKVTASEDDVKVTGLITPPPSTTSNGKVVRTATITFNETFRNNHPEFKFTDLYDKSFSERTQLVIKPAGNTGYKFVSSTGAANPTYSWTQSSTTTPPLFIVKRNEFDAITFSSFVKVTVDGKQVAKGNYTTSKGSLRLTLKAAYLNKLSKSDGHKLKVYFKDGIAETKFSIKGSSTTKRSSTNTSRTSTNSGAATRTSTSTNPSTGDAANWITWLVLAAGSAAVLAIILFVKKRSGKKD